MSPAIPPSPQAHSPRVSKPMVLVVDDDREIARAVRFRLDRAGFAAIIAYDGLEALRLAEHCRLDAIVLDLRMPAMDGFAVLARLRLDSTFKIPAIILSADVAESARTRALDNGAAYFVEKPYRPRDLIVALNAALESRRRRESFPTHSGARDDGTDGAE